jgi:hypothetical protein
MDIRATIKLRNQRDRSLTFTMPRGLVLEATSSEWGVQNIALVQDYEFTLAAHDEVTVTVVGRCLNAARTVPNGNPGRVTPFRYAGPDFSQDAIWKRVAQPAFF